MKSRDLAKKILAYTIIEMLKSDGIYHEESNLFVKEQAIQYFNGARGYQLSDYCLRAVAYLKHEIGYDLMDR